MINRAIAFELLVMPCSTQSCFFIPNRFYPLSHNIDNGGSNGRIFGSVAGYVRIKHAPLAPGLGSGVILYEKFDLALQLICFFPERELLNFAG